MDMELVKYWVDTHKTEFDNGWVKPNEVLASSLVVASYIGFLVKENTNSILYANSLKGEYVNGLMEIMKPQIIERKPLTIKSEISGYVKQPVQPITMPEPQKPKRVVKTKVSRKATLKRIAVSALSAMDTRLKLELSIKKTPTIDELTEFMASFDPSFADIAYKIFDFFKAHKGEQLNRTQVRNFNFVKGVYDINEVMSLLSTNTLNLFLTTIAANHNLQFIQCTFGYNNNGTKYLLQDKKCTKVKPVEVKTTQINYEPKQTVVKTQPAIEFVGSKNVIAKDLSKAQIKNLMAQGKAQSTQKHIYKSELLEDADYLYQVVLSTGYVAKLNPAINKKQFIDDYLVLTTKQLEAKYADREADVLKSITRKLVGEVAV